MAGNDISLPEVKRHKHSRAISRIRTMSDTLFTGRPTSGVAGRRVATTMTDQAKLPSATAMDSAAAAAASAAARTGSSHHSHHGGESKVKKQIYVMMSVALGLFLLSTFVLVEMLPSPAAYTDSMIVGVHSAMEIKHPNDNNSSIGKDRRERVRNNEDNNSPKVKKSNHLRHHYERMTRQSPKSTPEVPKLSRGSPKGMSRHEKPENQTHIPAINKHGKVEQVHSHAKIAVRQNSTYQKSQPEHKIAENSINSGLGHHEEGSAKQTLESGNGRVKVTKPAAEQTGHDDKGSAHPKSESDHRNNPGKALVDDTKEEWTQQQQQSIAAATTNNTTKTPRLIHILETRFMQMQPNLVQLAKARLHLLKTICLPTVVGQSAWGKFVWIIRTDPNLHEDIKKDLVTMLDEAGALVKKEEKSGKEDALTYVIGSNDNFIVTNTTIVSPGLRPFDIHNMLSSALSKPESIFAGKVSSMQMLKDEVSPERIGNDVIIWTRLDADDGLNIGFMEYIQSQAIRFFLPERYYKEIKTTIPEDTDDDEEEEEDSGDDDKNQTMIKNVYTPPQWSYWCSGRNIDWFLTDPIHDPQHKNGTVYPVIHANVCITPGVTVAMHGASDPLKVPLLDHHDIISYLRPKGAKPCGRTGLSVFDEEGIPDDEQEEDDDGSCFHMVTGGIASVRARTPTSAGMLGVNPDANQMAMIKQMPRLTNMMWLSMKEEFRISNNNLLETNSYFAEHVYDIAEENARGQCTVGHSCKSSSKDRLEQYVDLKDEMRGGFDIVDGAIIIANSKPIAE